MVGVTWYASDDVAAVAVVWQDEREVKNNVLLESNLAPFSNGSLRSMLKLFFVVTDASGK